MYTYWYYVLCTHTMYLISIYYVKKRKLSFCGHTLQTDNSLEKHITQGTLDGKRARGRWQVNWLNNITGWTGVGLQDVLRATEDRAEWRRIIHSAINPRIEEDWRPDKTRQDKVNLEHVYQQGWLIDYKTTSPWITDVITDQVSGILRTKSICWSNNMKNEPLKVL